MSIKLIQALPLSYHWQRIVDTKPELSPTDKVKLLDKWNLALSQKFSFVEMPKILKGWDYQNPSEYREYIIGPFGTAGVWRFGKEWSFDTKFQVPKPSTINKFLSHFDDAGLNAYFSPEWIKENDLA